MDAVPIEWELQLRLARRPTAHTAAQPASLLRCRIRLRPLLLSAVDAPVRLNAHTIGGDLAGDLARDVSESLLAGPGLGGRLRLAGGIGGGRSGGGGGRRHAGRVGAGVAGWLVCVAEQNS